MIYRSYGFVFAAFFVSAICALPALAQDKTPPLYTAAQAQQGATLYGAQCAACHGAQLEGIVGPALTGSAFHQMAAAQSLTGKTLLDVISQTMPMSAPGTLKPEEYAAIVSYILQRSGYPAGQTALTKDDANLNALNLGIDPAAGAAPAQGAAAAPAGPAMRLASQGVYTEAQLEQGKSFYSDNCLQCHGGELDGVEDAPPLAGALFLSRWGGLPVGALHAFIDKNMPPGNAGALGAVSEADVIAYILSKNGFPAGSTSLPADPAGLGGIAIK